MAQGLKRPAEGEGGAGETEEERSEARLGALPFGTSAGSERGACDIGSKAPPSLRLPLSAGED
eukprot:517753-Pyramimonas_sp.AAC.1